MRIRTYEAKDIPFLVELACECLATLPNYAQIKPSPERIHQLLSNNINNDGYWMMRVLVTDDDQIAGQICAYCSMCVFSFDMITNDVFLYIIPEWRTLNSTVKLIRAYRDWAIARKAKIIGSTTTGGYRVESLDKLLQREGFVPVGTLYHHKQGV